MFAKVYQRAKAAFRPSLRQPDLSERNEQVAKEDDAEKMCPTRNRVSDLAPYLAQSSQDAPINASIRRADNESCLAGGVFLTCKSSGWQRTQPRAESERLARWSQANR